MAPTFDNELDELDDPPDEPPDDELAAGAALGAGDVDVEAGVELVEVDVELVELGVVEELDELDESDFFADEYRSLYQPPPLRIKPPPPEICRRAVLLLQLGQVSIGFSVMRCSASQLWSQEEQAYS